MTHADPTQNPAESRPVARRQRLLAAILLATALAAVVAPRAGAVSDAEELTRFGGAGSAAGKTGLPYGIATDPVTGHVYVSDAGNSRIDEFTPWGNFVKAFGWDVAPGAVNEQQEVRLRASGGQFKLSFGADTTADIAFNAPGSEAEGPGSVEAALNALPSIGGAGASASVEAVPGFTDGQVPYVYAITFKGSLAGTDVPQLVASNGTAAPSGGVPSTYLEARTRADGTTGGSGLESCTTESGCKAGLEGAGAGEFVVPSGIAVDVAGNVYAKDRFSPRVQKFDSAGRFLLMFGKEVNATTKEDRCTKAQLLGGDECAAGELGNGPGQFISPGSTEGLAVNSAGKLFAADVERIQRFNAEGEFEAAVAVPGVTVRQLALDPLSGSFYVSLEGAGNDILKLDAASGAEIGRLKDSFSPVATAPSGAVFAEKVKPEGGQQHSILQFDSTGTQVSEFGLAEVLPPPNLSEDNRFSIQSLGTNAIGDVYVGYGTGGIDSFIRAFGPGPASFEAPPRQAPAITAQFATSVDRKGATLRADINPHFFTDTHYYVQYGTGKCSEGGCDESQPAAPGALLTTKIRGTAVRSAGISLQGLQPATTYHYRFVAESSGGGPVVGEEKSFTTYPAQAPPKTDCPNQEFRTSLSALLPDCRAYEMVSPVDKENGDIQTIGDADYLDLSSPDGERFAYSSYRAFAGSKSAPFVSQYLASRQPGAGWQTEALNAGQGPGANSVFHLDNPYKAFSADLCTSWLVVAPEPPLAPGVSEGYADVYRRAGCGEAGYEALIQVKPTIEPTSFNNELELQGASADGSKAILRAKDKLTEDAAAAGPWQTYYASEGALHLICVLPDGVPGDENCSGGTAAKFTDLHRTASLSHAISADGSRVYWTASPLDFFGSGPGTIYMRENPDRPESGETDGKGNCIREAAAACTVAVSGTETNRPSRFLGASTDGSKALFEVDDPAASPTPKNHNLYLFDLEAGESSLVAGKVIGVAGASEDLSRVYFVSEEALEGEAKAGQPNLYLSEEGTVGFIATLSKNDVAPDTAFEPIHHAARASAAGSSLTFLSTAQLSSYDTTDAASPLSCGEKEGSREGVCDSEVYLYEAGATGPVCVSCNPSGARPQGRVEAGELPAAATLPLPASDLNFPHPLSADGGRLFFESFDPLLPRDTNGKTDVYEWQAASSAEDCTQAGAELYVPSATGCLSLISSGQSPQDSKFLDISADGNDAFFTTSASLLPQDPGLIDAYDARIAGGFAPPPAPPALCEGEACQGPPSPPDDPTPSSASFSGAGNVSSPSRCAKGKARRNGRCAAKKPKRAKKGHAAQGRTANHHRGASR